MNFSFSTFFQTVFLLFLFLHGWGVQAQTETGEASYYADSFQGRPTASGQPYDRNKFTCAHRTLPFGTRVQVTRTDNGKSVVVTVNDRGPHKKGRIVDLSYAAANQIGLVRDGIAPVGIEVVGTTAQPASNPTATTPPVNPPPVVRPSPNAATLPLRDHNGNLIGTAPNTSTPAMPNTAPTTATGTAVPVPGLEDAAKQAPTLYQFVAFKLDAEGFGVQVGAYFNFYKLMQAMDDLSEKGVQNTMVQSSLKDGKPVFRILVGPYANRTEANNSKKQLEKKKIKGIVLDLSTLK